MAVNCIAGQKLEDTGFSHTMPLIRGKYILFIFYTLACYEIVRSNEMKKCIDGISFKR